MKKFSHIFKPFAIPPVQLKNRITMAPLFIAYAYCDGTVSPLLLSHFEELAKGGVAMIVVANVSVDPSGILSRYSLRADHDHFIPGLSKLAQTIKKGGAVATLQINHGGRFALGDNVYAPSSIPLTDIHAGGFYKNVLKSLDIQQQWEFLSEAIHRLSNRPEEMSLSDIQRILSSYAEAAERAKRAGFDMVEIHGATGYLPVQFLSPRTNVRKDRYGGNLENRMRLPIELVKSVREAVGSNFPVGYRFLADERMPNGFSLDESKIFARKLSNLDMSYLSVTCGTYEFFYNPEIIKKIYKPEFMISLAEQIKQVVNIPVIASGRIATPELAEKILREGKADLIGLARPLFADPKWVQKALSEEEYKIVPCTECGTCFQSAVTERPALCPQWERIKIMKRKDMIKDMQNPRKNILVTMDGSENAAMGAAYAADILRNRKDVKLTLLHIQKEGSIPNEVEVRKMMDMAKALLLEAGIPKKAITVKLLPKRMGVARDILNELDEGGYGTVIIGRRGISKAEQFLLGSVSNKIIQNAKNCSVWIID
jgi:2,4-dienoyl-CoA reductase-like NADH-dependent reductase (Old Yellow Enzyme family)/nucleotide-binding universal stress UspA family protein